MCFKVDWLLNSIKWLSFEIWIFLIHSIVTRCNFWSHQIFIQLVDDLSKPLADLTVISKQARVLVYNVANFSFSKAVSKYFCLLLYFLHQVGILMNHFAYFTLEISPDFLFVLHNVLCFVQLHFEFFNLSFLVFYSLDLLHLKVDKHLLLNEYIGLCFISAFSEFS